MGNCLPSNATDSSVESATAKLILMDGSIQEFCEEIRSEEILREYPGHFICNSDGLYVGENISQVLGDGDQLQIGQLYFLLPQRKLLFVLTATDMASLLFKISTTLSAQNKAATKRQKKSKLSCGFGKTQVQVQPLFDIHIHSQHDECEEKYKSSSVCCIQRNPNISFSISTGRGRIQLQSKLETIAEIV